MTIKSYNLDQKIVDIIIEKAKEDGRSASCWLNRHLESTLLPKKPKPKPKADKPKDPNRFKKPSIKEIEDFAKAENLSLTGFNEYYSSNGWRVGKNPMKDWKAAARGWSKRQSQYSDNKGYSYSFMDTEFK